MQVAEISRSPRTSTALIADPGTIGSGCAWLELPPPIPEVAVRLDAGRLSCQSLMAWALKPLKTSGVSIGWTVAALATESRPGLLFAPLDAEFPICAVEASALLGCGRGGLVAYLEHLFNRRDAGDRFLAELADAIGERAEQLAVDIDRAAAHAGNHPRVFGLGADEPGEDHVLSGTEGVVQQAEDFDLHRFGLGALKDGIGDAAKAAVHLAERKNPGGGGGRRGGGQRNGYRWSDHPRLGRR